MCTGIYMCEHFERLSFQWLRPIDVRPEPAAGEHVPEELGHGRKTKQQLEPGNNRASRFGDVVVIGIITIITKEVKWAVTNNYVLLWL